MVMHVPGRRIRPGGADQLVRSDFHFPKPAQLDVCMQVVSQALGAGAGCVRVRQWCFGGETTIQKAASVTALQRAD